MALSDGRRWGRGLAGRRNCPQNLDGEIKAPGPSRSMSLVVLDNFRDLVFSQGPGNMNFLNSDSDLSGTTRMGRRDWSRSNH